MGLRMLENIKIKKKLPLIMISFGLISAALIGTVSHYYAANQLIEAAESKLTALLESRKESLLFHFEVINQDVQFHSQNPLTKNAMTSLSASWKELPDPKQETIQDLYIFNNPYVQGQKESLLYAEDGSSYSEGHKQYHHYFRNLAATRGYYDILLVDPQGNIIYTVKKDNDFGLNLLTGTLKNSNLAEAFTLVNRNPARGVSFITDYRRHPTSNNKPASFISAPIHTDLGQYIGVLIFQMPIDVLNSVMHVSAGMGLTGETFLVGQDKLMRSDSRFYGANSILNTRVDTQSADFALKGMTGIFVEDDYRGIPVFTAFTPIEFMGLKWAAIAEIEQDEILASLHKMTTFLLLAGGAVLIFIFAAGFQLASNIADPIVSMTKIMNKLANNDLTTNISVSERQDELGTMASTLEVFKANAIERDKLQKELTHLAHHDLLTGLPTRQLIMERLSDITVESQQGNLSFAVMFADLDNFKAVNDTLGHNIGDEVIKTAARIFEDVVTESNFVARIGGDEFIILLTNVEDDDAVMAMANKLVSSTKAGLSVVSSTVEVTLSLGIAIYPEDGRDAASLIHHADQAMYRAKEASKNRCSR
ncbi:diguanylate cyclase [Enterovibrio norvegicus]|nr:diguanylate cyclase [Enterovibrio norvegicus]OEF64823.1 diguanylate cyclase [Enterovibrio norvegicus]